MHAVLELDPCATADVAAPRDCEVQSATEKGAVGDGLDTKLKVRVFLFFDDLDSCMRGGGLFERKRADVVVRGGRVAGRRRPMLCI